MCSDAMVIGMGYDEFWKSNWSRYYAYVRKSQIESEVESKRIDYVNWLNGKYTKAALESVYHMFNGMIDAKKAKLIEYPEKPFLEQIEEQKRRAKKRAILEREAKRIEAYNKHLEETILKDK